MLDAASVKRRLGRLQPGRKTSFGYDQWDTPLAGGETASRDDSLKVRNLVLAQAKVLGFKVSTHINRTKRTIEVTRALA